MAYIEGMLPEASSKQISASGRHPAQKSLSSEPDTALTSTKRTSSNLESLPNEVLQKVFWESLELNMIGTCKSIAFSLPGFWRYARPLVLLAFCGVNTANRLKICLPQMPPCSGLGCPLSEDDRKKLQKHVLESGWLTIDMLKMATGEIQEAHVQRYWVNATIKTLPAYKEAFEDRWQDSEDVLNRTLESYGVDADGDATTFVMLDPFDIELKSINKIDAPWYQVFRTLEVDVIPDGLLEKPVTDRNLGILEFLWKSHSDSLGQSVARSEPAMCRAVQHAISINNIYLTCLLILLRMHSFSAGARVEDFQTAAKCNHSEILRLLLEVNSRDFPHNDPNLEQWARLAKDKGDKFGPYAIGIHASRSQHPEQHSFVDFLTRKEHGSILKPHYVFHRELCTRSDLSSPRNDPTSDPESG